MRPRPIARLAVLLALALPVAALQTAQAAQAETTGRAAASVVLYDQTANAAPPTADSAGPNFSPSNYFDVSNNDRTADDFTVPAGATWALNEIDVTGALENPIPTPTVNVYLYANAAGKPGAEVFSQVGITPTNAPDFVVPLTGVPSLAAGTYWITVQLADAGASYWSWGTNTVQRGNPATWWTNTSSPSCPAGAWAARMTCWTGTNPDQVFTLKGTDLTPSNDLALGKPERNTDKGTASLPATVPGPGSITLSGKGVVRRAGATLAAGTVHLKVKAKGAAKRTLKATGKVTVTVQVTFTPTGGNARTVTKKVKLRKKLV